MRKLYLLQATHPLIRTSQVSLSSNPDADFRYSMIFTPIGLYKGQLYAIKKIRKKSVDITREMKKELKLVSSVERWNLFLNTVDQLFPKDEAFSRRINFSTQDNQNKSQIIPRTIDKQPNSGRNLILIGSQFIAGYYSPTKTNPYIIFNYSFIMASKQNEGEKYILPSSIILADLGLKNIIIPFHSNWNLSSNKTLYHQITPFCVPLYSSEIPVTTTSVPS